MRSKEDMERRLKLLEENCDTCYKGLQEIVELMEKMALQVGALLKQGNQDAG